MYFYVFFSMNMVSNQTKAEGQSEFKVPESKPMGKPIPTVTAPTPYSAPSASPTPTKPVGL